jgi:hypothetical protein
MNLMLTARRSVSIRCVLLLLLVFRQRQSVESFQQIRAAIRYRVSYTTPCISQSIEKHQVHLFGSSPFAADDEAVHTHQDKNGKDIVVDSIVRVVALNLKAYQVNPKSGFGAYNDKKEFVYSNASPYLILPQGLRGRVMRVYDENVVAANFPIQVKFTPGENVEGGYDVPVAFMMHFLQEELECV